ncbi:hypothetical protein D3O62_17345 [Vibrio cholerae]|nr:hypothetical protein [Vibrio cholerae]
MGIVFIITSKAQIKNQPKGWLLYSGFRIGERCRPPINQCRIRARIVPSIALSLVNASSERAVSTSMTT